MKSNCCKATMTVSTADEGTSCYMCTKCGQPCDPATTQAKGKCKEYWEKIPYTSEHLWQGDIHGLPSGNCQKCGMPIQEWNRKLKDKLDPNTPKNPSPESQEGWENKLRDLIENWKYNAGDDVLASALADEVIKVFRQILASHDKALIENIKVRIKWLKSQCKKEKHHPYESNSCVYVYTRDELEALLGITIAQDEIRKENHANNT